MRRVTLPWGMVLCTLVLAACGGGAPGATQTAIGLVVGASPLTILATEVPPIVTAMPPTAPNAEPATATLPPVPTATAGTAQPGLPSASGDPLLRTYRSLVAIQMNAALVAEALGQVQAGRVGPDEMPVAALAIGAMTQAVDESLPSVTPPASVKAQWEAAVARHAEVKELGARWLLGQMDVPAVSAAMVPIQADLERLLVEAEAAVAAQYGVSAAELTAHRVRLVAALGNVFE